MKASCIPVSVVQLVFCIVLLAAMSTHAAVLVTDPVTGKLVGATGVDVGGHLYEVAFLPGTCEAALGGCTSDSFAFQTSVGASLAAQALMDQVFIDGPLGLFDTDPVATVCMTSLGTCAVQTPYSSEIQDTQLLIHIVTAVNKEFEIDDSIRQVSLYEGARVWADWRSATVPLPGSIWLYASLLGCVYLARLHRGSLPA